MDRSPSTSVTSAPGVLDAALTEARSRLGLTVQAARAVLGGLLTFINHDIGGIDGFLDRFRTAGQSTLLRSWLSGEAVPIAADTVERALGHDAIERIASMAGVSFSTATSTIAQLLPAVVGRIASGGVVPPALSGDLVSYITAPATISTTRLPGAQPAPSALSPAVGRNWWPLVALVFLVVLIILLLTSSGGAGAVEEREATHLATERASAALVSRGPGSTVR